MSDEKIHNHPTTTYEGENPAIRERKRGSGKKKNSNSFLQSLGIDLSELDVQITLNPEDKKLVMETLNEISDKVDYRWKVTQGIMIVALLLSAGAQIVEWL
jgi:hypothetical protein